jgi:hypothetical protein
VVAGLRALRGAELRNPTAMLAALRAGGFQDVVERVHKCPVGPYPSDRREKRAGQFLRRAIMDGLAGVAKRPLINGLGWTSVQVEVFLVEVRRAVMDEGVHAYIPFHVVYARKPSE